MPFSLLTAKEQPPTAAQLAAALGPAQKLWDDVLGRMASAFAPVLPEWVYGGQKHGWSLRLKQNKRAIVYLTPGDRMLRAGFALGEKAIAAARAGKLRRTLLELIDQSPKYPEGRAVRIEVRHGREVGLVLAIAQIKMAH